LQQPQTRPHAPAAELALLLAVSAGILDDLALPRVAGFKAGFADALTAAHGALVERLDRTGRLEDADRTTLLEWLRSRAAALKATK
jgi:F0F1-type ATP synthase alpha subunit